MRAILWASHWFYPGGTSLLVWLTACSVLALITVLAGWMFTGAARKYFTALTVLLCGAGGLVCLAMIGVEAIIFEFGSPLCVAAYAGLLASFAWLFGQNLSFRPQMMQCAATVLLTSVAFTYLFYFGALPRIRELDSAALHDIEGANVLGRHAGTLPVTEFADFQCPACAMQDDAMDKLWNQYPDRIRYSFRHLPKRRHPHAAEAALASECASRQGRFWETKRLLFANQGRIAELLASAGLPTIPAEETPRYAECVQSRSAWSAVSHDLQRANSLGLNATPSIIVGNKLIEGMATYPRLALIVKRELGARQLLGTERAHARTDTGCGSSAVVHACAE